jgi:hypothetical protein
MSLKLKIQECALFGIVKRFLIKMFKIVGNVDTSFVLIMEVKQF